MKSAIIHVVTLFALAASLPAHAERVPSPAPDVATGRQVQELQQTMLQDEKTMEMVSALLADPQVQELLADPELMKAIQAGDMATLLSSEKFRALLNNGKIREIQRRLENH